MTVQLNPYLNWDNGRAEEAMDFYASVFGGTVEKMRFSDMEGGVPGVEDDELDHLMHSALVGVEGINLFGADVPRVHGPATAPSYISLSGDEDGTLRGYWDRLSDGAEIGEQLSTAPWGASFGMLTDKYGVPWMINIAGQSQG